MSATAIALQGLENADTQMNTAAEAIATNGTAPGSSGPNVADLGADMISLTSTQTLFEANIAALVTADEIETALINITT